MFSTLFTGSSGHGMTFTRVGRLLKLVAVQVVVVALGLCSVLARMREMVGPPSV